MVDSRPKCASIQVGGLELPGCGAFSSRNRGARMFTYRIERQQKNGSCSVQEFQSVDDADAITCGLRLRGAGGCELYQEDRWLATFDSVADANDVIGIHVNGKCHQSWVEMETEVAYFHRRALQERERSRNGVSAAAKLAHLATAEHLESYARAVEAVQRRRAFHDVNALKGTGCDYDSL